MEASALLRRGRKLVGWAQRGFGEGTISFLAERGVEAVVEAFSRIRIRVSHTSWSRRLVVGTTYVFCDGIRQSARNWERASVERSLGMCP